MLIEVLREIKNFFVVSKESSQFKIESGMISLVDNYLIGQHIAIERKTESNKGSLLNSGVYLLKDTLYTLDNVVDEVWVGSIYGLAIPKDLLELVEEIKAFNNSPQGKPTSIISESFGSKSYNRAINAYGQPSGWQTVFKMQLDRYRKMFVNINV